MRHVHINSLINHFEIISDHFNIQNVHESRQLNITGLTIKPSQLRICANNNCHKHNEFGFWTKMFKLLPN